MDDDENTWELMFPFTVCASAGGPYDDAGFVAGFTVGKIHGALDEMAHADIVAPFERTVPADLVDQLDLVAMHHGWTTDATPLGDGWATITFTPGAE